MSEWMSVCCSLRERGNYPNIPPTASPVCSIPANGALLERKDASPDRLRVRLLLDNVTGRPCERRRSDDQRWDERCGFCGRIGTLVLPAIPGVTARRRRR